MSSEPMVLTPGERVELVRLLGVLVSECAWREDDENDQGDWRARDAMTATKNDAKRLVVSMMLSGLVDTTEVA